MLCLVDLFAGVEACVVALRAEHRYVGDNFGESEFVDFVARLGWESKEPAGLCACGCSFLSVYLWLCIRILG